MMCTLITGLRANFRPVTILFGFQPHKSDEKCFMREEKRGRESPKSWSKGMPFCSIPLLLYQILFLFEF